MNRTKAPKSPQAPAPRSSHAKERKHDAAAAEKRSPEAQMPGDEGVLNPSDTFVPRHVGPDSNDIRQMLDVLELDSLDELIDETVPESIRLDRALNLPGT